MREDADEGAVGGAVEVGSSTGTMNEASHPRV